MRRREVLKRIQTEARRQGIVWALEREGANHSVYRLGDTMIPIPRHIEIGDRLAEIIFKETEHELGRWWR